jgi:hypothetical protein
VSEPLGFDLVPLADVADEAGILVTPPLAPYFPCISPAGFDGVLARPPGILVQTWPQVWQTSYLSALSIDRYFRWNPDTTEPLTSGFVGAHTGDVANFAFLSQEYLTGTPSRVNASVEETVSG